MVLGDVSRLVGFTADYGALLGARFREAGLTQAFLGPVFGTGERLDDALRGPMRVWKLRQLHEPRAVLARAFLFADPVTRDDVAIALGGLELFEALLRAGLLVSAIVANEPSVSHVVSPFRLDVAFELYFFSDALDAGGDAVMGPSSTTGQLAVAARPHEKVESILDLGCGAGVAAIALAERAERVVATDINPRALVFTRLNASLNGVRNVDVRVGDLFEPVRAERFALVVSQPPFVGLPDSVARPSFLFGGTRGDELALRAMGEVGRVLSPTGRAVFLVDFPIDDGLDPAARVREAVGLGGENVLVIASPERLLEDHCTLYAAGMFPTLGPAFAETALQLRDHFAREAVHGLALSIVVLDAATSPTTFTHTVRTKAFAAVAPRASLIGPLMKTIELLEAGATAAGWLQFRLREGVRFEPVEQVGVVVRPPAESPFLAWGTDQARSADLQLVASSGNLFGALLHAESGERLLATTLEGVLRGALEAIS